VAQGDSPTAGLSFGALGPLVLRRRVCADHVVTRGLTLVRGWRHGEIRGTQSPSTGRSELLWVLTSDATVCYNYYVK